MGGTRPDRRHGVCLRLAVVAVTRGAPMFVFYSNRLGCAGSVLVTLLGSVLLVAVIWLLNR